MMKKGITKLIFILVFIISIISFKTEAQVLNDYNPYDYDIPDNGVQVSSDLDLSGAPNDAVITKIKAYFEIKHTYPGDLDIWITFYDNGWHDYYLYHQGDLGSEDDVYETRDNINAWNGFNPNQTYYLVVQDRADQDVGYIDFFEMWVTYQVDNNLQLSVTPADLQTRDWGESVTYTITVYENDYTRLSNAIVGITDNLMNQSAEVGPTNSNGETTYTTTVPTNKPNGNYSVEFIGTKSGYENSPTFTRYVEVKHLSPPQPPTNPYPSNGATNVSIRNLELTWSNGGGEVTYYDIYFGTDPTPDASEYIGAGSEPQFLFGYDLLSSTTYYWRVDAVNPSGTTTGNIWNFTTSSSSSLPSKPINPNPSNGESNVSINTNLSWENGGGATSYKIYFGTDPTPDNSEYIKDHSSNSYDPGELAYSTTYYWRIDAVNSDGETTGDVWHFSTTTAPVSDIIWEDNFNNDNGWTDKVYQGEGTFNPGTYDGENICEFYMSGSPGVFYTFKQLSQSIPAGSILKSRWYYESSGAYSNSENSDGGHLLFINSIPNNQEGISSERIQDMFASVDYPMYQWNIEEFEITQTIPAGAYIAIGGAVWPSYIYNNWDYIKIYSSTTDISTELSLPSNYILYNNYPNPFNPTTKIKYDLPKASEVQLIVYDNLGREVATLVNEQKPAGSFEVEFNASQLSNGVYFYELRAGDFRDVKKLILLK